jgi:hypothetical protein
MGDLIDRQAAIDELNGQIEYCDKALRAFDIAVNDAYAVKVERASLIAYKGQLESIPAADVVPVVRCRDCKHWDNGNLSFECPWDYGRYGSSDEDDFCSYGERKG